MSIARGACPGGSTGRLCRLTVGSAASVGWCQPGGSWAAVMGWRGRGLATHVFLTGHGGTPAVRALADQRLSWAVPSYKGTNPVMGPRPPCLTSQRPHLQTPPHGETGQPIAHSFKPPPVSWVSCTRALLLSSPRGRDSEFSGKLWSGLDTRSLRVRDQRVWRKVCVPWETCPNPVAPVRGVPPPWWVRVDAH